MDSHTHDSPTDGARVTIRVVQGESESILRTILRGVAVAENVPVSELEPLYQRIETDALVALLNHADDVESGVRVEFTVHGHTVVVSDDGAVCITPATTAVGDGCLTSGAR
ncbi:HalOD1 output domain-containing protein [Natronorubrum aibiense]|uniref:HalOD1 output domain-containing protein n=1 Tax=Natronorubrum aibiense TaxID=348826 RepID=UPI0013866A59|nr:HalOD1 output domain-containing protein [Natronorubrum aibiense]